MEAVIILRSKDGGNFYPNENFDDIVFRGTRQLEDVGSMIMVEVEDLFLWLAEFEKVYKEEGEVYDKYQIVSVTVVEI